MTTLDITTDEWEAAARIVDAASPDETSPDHGVAVVSNEGLRWWLAWNEHVVFISHAFTAGQEPEGSGLISPRLVQGASRYIAAGEADSDRLPLEFVDGWARVFGGYSVLAFESPTPRPIPGALPELSMTATATIYGNDLRVLLDASAILPAGVDPRTVDVPPFVMAFEGAGIAFRADWSAAGAPACDVSAHAGVTGEGAVIVPPTAFCSAFHGVEGDDEVTILMPADADLVIVETPYLTARVRAAAVSDTSSTDETWEQLQLFDAELHRSEPSWTFEGWSLGDIRALTLDPDVDIRIAATRCRWNLDHRVQQVLATDPDERVVLALLEQVDPYLDVCEMIIAGPHAAARRRLLRKNPRTELVERLAEDADPLTAEGARRILLQRGRPAVSVDASVAS